MIGAGEEEMAHDEVGGAGVDAEGEDAAADVFLFDKVEKACGELFATGFGGKGKAVDYTVRPLAKPGVVELVVGGIADGKQAVAENLRRHVRGFGRMRIERSICPFCSGE